MGLSVLLPWGTKAIKTKNMMRAAEVTTLAAEE
jgi:hypothetical protein